MDSIKKSAAIGRLAGPLAPAIAMVISLILGIEIEEGEVKLVFGQLEALITAGGYLYGFCAAAWSKYKQKKGC